MPTYEYVCKACGHAWEAQQRISESPLTECPKCHEATAQRQISAGNFILKGGGWYADLYSSSGSKKSDKPPAETTASKPSEPPKSAAKDTKDTSSTTTTTTTSTTTTKEK